MVMIITATRIRAYDVLKVFSPLIEIFLRLENHYRFQALSCQLAILFICQLCDLMIRANSTLKIQSFLICLLLVLACKISNCASVTLKFPATLQNFKLSVCTVTLYAAIRQFLSTNIDALVKSQFLSP